MRKSFGSCETIDFIVMSRSLQGLRSYCCYITNINQAHFGTAEGCKESSFIDNKILKAEQALHKQVGPQKGEINSSLSDFLFNSSVVTQKANGRIHRSFVL